MRYIHFGKRGSEAALEEPPDKLRNTVRFEQEAPNTSSSSTMHVSLEYPASGDKQDRPEPVLVQNSGHVDDDQHISRLDVFYEMDGRKSRYTNEVFGSYRQEDAADLRRNEFHELVESMTCLSAFEGKIWKSWKSEKSNQNIVTNEVFVKNTAAGE